ncbi:MAG: DUF1667 domain-containing protein [Dehalococcoidia bacterium]|nr:DUF1667 domain-containing protein [Dehalococcoidia bacterium]
MPSAEIICLECPTACLLDLVLDEGGNITECRGAQCKRGLPYAQQELKEPKRVLTTTVLTEGSKSPLLSVRTDRPIPRDKLMEGVRSLGCLRVRPPVHAGQVVLAGFMDGAASIIACDDLVE